MPPAGLDPHSVSRKDFKSLVSANFTTVRIETRLTKPAALDIHREPGITGDEVNIYHKSVVTELQTCIKTCKIHTTAIIIQ